MADPSRCFSVPPIVKPTIPGISFSAPGIKFSFDKSLCCKSLSLSQSAPPSPPLPIPPIILMALVEVLGELVDEINALLAQIVPRCPRS